MSGRDYIADVASVLLQRRIQTTMSVLAMYEFVITIDQEISAVWKRKLSVASILLFATRWAMVLQAIIALAPDAKTTPGCVAEGAISEVALLTLFLITAAFSALRVYALWDNSKLLAGVVFLLQLSPFVSNMWSSIHSEYRVLPAFGCTQIVHFGLKTFTTLVRTSRIPAILGDALVVAVTWVRSFRQVRKANKLGMSVPLSSMLFRDGTAYFLLLLAINVLELCTNLSEAGEGVAHLATVMPPILINRFLLNLRQLSEPNTSSEGLTHSISTPMFRMTIDVTGNMGESLDHGWVEERSDRENSPENDTTAGGPGQESE